MRLCLVAGRQHDPTPYEYGLATELRVISLLHGREERVEVGVQDRRLHEHMFACAAAALASRRRPGSARPSELLFDLAVGGRLWRELVEGRVEEALGVFVSTLAAADNGEVCDHLSLVFLVAELSKGDERLVEVLNRYGDAAAMHESESEVVERQRLGLPVTELTHDRERGTMLLGCLFVLAFTSKLRSVLIESKRLTLAVDRDRFRPKSL